MVTFEARLQAIKDRFFPDGKVDRVHIQKVLTEDFVVRLLLRGDQTIEDVMDDFVRLYEEQLHYLGNQTQDAMLRDAEKMTDIDLSFYYEEQKDV